MLRTLAFCPLALALLLGSVPASAAEASLEQTLSGNAANAYESAKLLFNNSDFAHAKLKYQQAYDLSKDPRLLYDMAICEKNLHAYARMESLLVEYKREMGSRMSEEDGKIVDGALEAVKKLVGTVTLTVNEPGARVAVDGESKGTTPLAAPLVLDLGTHALTVTKLGFAEDSRQVEIKGGNAVDLTVTLAATSKPARLVVIADAGAAIAIDGRVAGIGRFDASVTPGAHAVHVTGDHKKPYDTSVDLRQGEVRTLSLSLQSQPSGHPVWPWLIGGAVVVAGAAVGGYFLFKPHDQTTPIPPGKLTGVTFSLVGR